MSVTGIILAGGKSARLGRDKAMLPINGNSFIGHIADQLRLIADEIIVVSNQPEKYALPNTREVQDIFPGKGPLAGIHAGLTAASNEYSFVMACDMPSFHPRAVAFLFSQSTGYDVTVPQIGQYLEPLFAVYHKNALPLITDALSQGIYKVTDFYPKAKINYVTEEHFLRECSFEECFFNVNTPDDYVKLSQKEKGA